MVVKDLKCNGRNVPVTNRNKAEYIDLMVNWRLRASTAAQSDALVKGFREVGGGEGWGEGSGWREESIIAILLRQCSTESNFPFHFISAPPPILFICCTHYPTP